MTIQIGGERTGARARMPVPTKTNARSLDSPQEAAARSGWR